MAFPNKTKQTGRSSNPYEALGNKNLDALGLDTYGEKHAGTSKKKRRKKAGDGKADQTANTAREEERQKSLPDDDEKFTSADEGHVSQGEGEPSASNQGDILPHALRTKMLDFALSMTKILADSEEPREIMRLVLWRAVIRANYFWIDPDTNQAAPLQIVDTAPAGLSVEGYVFWQAVQMDKVGRSVPTPAYCARIQVELRSFCQAAKDGNEQHLAHLAYLLTWVEETDRASTSQKTSKKVVTLSEMQQWIARAFSGSDVALDFEHFNRGTNVTEEQLGSAEGSAGFESSQLAAVESLWEKTMEDFV